MLELLSFVKPNTMFQITVLLGGVATFCAVVLSRANPLCVWIGWAGSSLDEDTGKPDRAHIEH